MTHRDRPPDRRRTAAEAATNQAATTTEATTGETQMNPQTPAPAPVYPPYGSDVTAVLDTASGGGAGAG